MSTENFLELGKQPVRFDPVGAVTNVFFDESNLQVCLCSRWSWLYAPYCTCIFIWKEDYSRESLLKGVLNPNF